MVLNTRGHTNFEVDFEQLFENFNHLPNRGRTSPSAAFMDFENNIFSVFAFGDQVAFYQGTSYVNTVRLGEGVQAVGLLPEESSVLVVCKDDKENLKTFRISMDSFSSEEIAKKSGLYSQWKYQMTASMVVLQKEDKVESLFDVRTL